jgi:hypothetical protein
VLRGLADRLADQAQHCGGNRFAHPLAARFHGGAEHAAAGKQAEGGAGILCATAGKHEHHGPRLRFAAEDAI